MRILLVLACLSIDPSNILIAAERIAVPFTRTSVEGTFTQSAVFSEKRPFNLEFPPDFPVNPAICFGPRIDPVSRKPSVCRMIEAQAAVEFNDVIVSVGPTTPPSTQRPGLISLFSPPTFSLPFLDAGFPSLSFVDASGVVECIPGNTGCTISFPSRSFPLVSRARTDVGASGPNFPAVREISFGFGVNIPPRAIIPGFFTSSLISVSMGISVSGNVLFEVEPSVSGCGDEPLTTTLLDPVPTLVQGAAVTTDLGKLDSEGRVVKGVAADGTAQLVLRIQGVCKGDQVRVRLPVNRSTTADLEGSLRGLESSTESQEITVIGQDSSPPMAFAVYRSPMDFSDGTSDTAVKERFINLRVERVSGTAGVDVPVTIVRPPVILVHGLWDNATNAWSGFTPLITSPAFDVHRDFDYEATNDDLFLVNADKLQYYLRSKRIQIANERNIAIGQFDFVAHSMGGNVVRSLGRVRLSLTPWNFRKGYVHKLITLGTPHLGSPLARELVKPENACVAEAFSSIDKGAVSDLAGNGDGTGLSSSLQAQLSVPVAMLAGHLAPSQFTGMPDWFRKLIDQLCKSNGFTPPPLADRFTPTNYRSLMGGGHDGIVPVKSALGNLTWPAANTWGGDEEIGTVGAWHSFFTSVAFAANIDATEPWLTQSDEIFADRVVRLLSVPVNGSEFRK